MAGRDLVVGIDQGTTGTAVLVVDGEGNVAGRAYREHLQRLPAPGWVEHDGEEIWSTVVALLGEALARAGGGGGADAAGAEVVALGVANQRETTLLWDRRSGDLVAPVVVWQDRRGAAICERLVAAGLGPLVERRTGLVLHPYFSASKLTWLFEADPALRRRAEHGELCFGTMDSFLLWRLSGGALHVTDATNASRTLLMSLNELAWDLELCELFGVPAAVLPRIVASVGALATTAPSAVPMLPGVPLAGVLGDQQAALLAQACQEPGQAKSTYGTGSFILAHSGGLVAEPGSGLVATVALAEAGGRRSYALEGSIFVTGAAVQWLRDGLGLIADAGESEQLARSLPGNDDVFFVPALAGLGAPYWDPSARGTLLGATLRTTRAHLARAVLESIAYRTRDVLEAMARAGMPVTVLRADGGATANNWLMQFQADVAGVPVDVAAVADTTALGAAYAAGLGVRRWSGVEEVGSLRRSRARFEPGLDRGQADRLYGRWLAAVERARGWAEPPLRAQ